MVGETDIDATDVVFVVSVQSHTAQQSIDLLIYVRKKKQKHTRTRARTHTNAPRNRTERMMRANERTNEHKRSTRKKNSHRIS